MPERRDKKDSGKKRVLFIIPNPPLPLYGMTIRWHNHYLWLKERYSLDLLYLTEKGKGLNSKEIREIKKFFDNVYCFEYSKLHAYANAAAALIGGTALQYRYFYVPEAHEWIKKNARRYHIMFFNTVRTAKYAENIDHNNMIIDLTDAISLNYKLSSKRTETGVRGALWKCIYLLDSIRLIKHEVDASEKFKVCLITTSRDKEWIVTHGGNPKKIIVIKNPVKKCNGKISEEDAVTFVGKLDYPPNEAAVLWFAKEIFPLVKERFLELKFYIVGMNPTERIKRLSSRDIIVTGYVPNVQEYYLRSKAVIVPIKFGAGVQNKALEAMACGRPVVITRVSAGGIEAKDGRDYLVADSEREFASKVLLLLKDRALRDEIGKNAREFVRQNHDPKKLKRVFLNHLF